MNSFFFLRICAVSTNFVSPLPLFFARFFLSFFLRRSSLPFIYYFYRSFSLGTILSTISFLFSFPAPPLLLTIPSVFFIPFLSLSLSFHLPVEHIISLLFPAFVRTRVSLSLSLVFSFSSFVFHVAIPLLSSTRNEVLVLFSFTVESVRNERNDYGANGVAMSPTGYRVSGRDWQQSIHALSFTILLFIHPISFSLSLSISFSLTHSFSLSFSLSLFM